MSSLEHKLRTFVIIILNTNEKTGNLAKACIRSWHREKNLRTRNCRRKFMKNLIPEKRKDNI